MPARRELPKRIIWLELLASLLDPAGAEAGPRYRLLRDFPWLYEAGWEIERWGLRPHDESSSTWKSLQGPRFPFRAFPRVLLPPLVWLTQFLQTMRRPRAGLFVAYRPIMGPGAAAALLVRRRPSVLVIRIEDDQSGRTRLLYRKRMESRVLQALERFALKRADLVLPMSSFTHAIATRAGVPEDRIEELPVPARASGEGLTPLDKSGPPRIAFAGRLIPEKGVDVLLWALWGVAEEFPDVTLDVAGDGRERANLEELAASLGIAGRVRFHGWVGPNQISALFAASLVSVLPSRINEGMGMVLVEAGLAGCALIGSDVGGIRDVVHPDRTGILVPPNDPGALADALAALLRDPAEARRLGEGARAEARSYLTRRDEAVERVRARMETLRSGRRQ